MEYAVEIQTSIWGEVIVEAKDKDEAYQIAHEEFDYTDSKHKFDQQTTNIREIKS